MVKLMTYMINFATNIHISISIRQCHSVHFIRPWDNHIILITCPFSDVISSVSSDMQKYCKLFIMQQSIHPYQIWTVYQIRATLMEKGLELVLTKDMTYLIKMIAMINWPSMLSCLQQYWSSDCSDKWCWGSLTTQLTLKWLGHFFFKMWFHFLMLFTLCAIVLYETGPIQCMFSQHCGYWWPGALAPGHQ